jgi:hypothetical protein
MQNLARAFEHERLKRTIEEAQDPETLRKLALLMLGAWTSQQAAVEQLMQQGWLPR